MKLSDRGSSRSSAMPQLMRMAVFMQLRVVPTMAMATVIAMVIISPKPKPGMSALPSSFVMSPSGALEAAAAAIPVTPRPPSRPVCR